MSMIYSITVSLNVDIDKSVVHQLLLNGANIGFCYYDYIMGESYDDAPILNAEQATNKILKLDSQYYWNETINDIYASFEDTGFFITFKQTEDGFLSIRLSGWGNPRMIHSFFDFSYYIRQALDLCDGFIVLNLKTDAF